MRLLYRVIAQVCLFFQQFRCHVDFTCGYFPRGWKTFPCGIVGWLGLWGGSLGLMVGQPAGTSLPYCLGVEFFGRDPITDDYFLASVRVSWRGNVRDWTLVRMTKMFVYEMVR